MLERLRTFGFSNSAGNGFKPFPALSDYDYELPKDRIAQFALPVRGEARLLVLDRASGSIGHAKFTDLVQYFHSGDVLVLNDTRVIPARLFGNRRSGGKVELLVLGELPDGGPASPTGGRRCQVLIRPSSRIKAGEEISLSGGAGLRVLDGADSKTGIREVEFLGNETVPALLERSGRVPLPPYIDREDIEIDRELYQTVFAKRAGAVASPTAGLHFDEPLLSRLKEKGVEILFVTLHVGYGTFQPVQVEEISKHEMHEEYFEVSERTARAVNAAKREGRSVTACGTTVTRALESAAIETFPYEVRPTRAKTKLFIYPPYEFKIPTRLITNFHLPKSTLLMLTSAFAGRELLMEAYREAIREGYRFYSYGDAMLVV